MFGSPLRLHAQIFNLGLQSNLVYRWNFLLRVVVSFIPLMGWLFFWQAVFKDNHSGFPGYTYQSMMAYFVTIIFCDTLTTPNEDDFQIAEEIREGQLNAILLKPLDHLIYRFHLFASARFIHAASALVPLSIALIFLQSYFAHLPWLTHLPAALLAVLLAAMLQFLICYTLAMIAFWVLEIGSVTFIIYSVEYLLSGHLFPVDAFPATLQRLCLLTPFPYETFFPVAVLLGHETGFNPYYGFAMQAFWIIVFYVLARLTWRLGLRTYTAVGG